MVLYCSHCNALQSSFTLYPTRRIAQQRNCKGARIIAVYVCTCTKTLQPVTLSHCTRLTGRSLAPQLDLMYLHFQPVFASQMAVFVFVFLYFHPLKCKYIAMQCNALGHGRICGSFMVGSFSPCLIFSSNLCPLFSKLLFLYFCVCIFVF